MDNLCCHDAWEIHKKQTRKNINNLVWHFTSDISPSSRSIQPLFCCINILEDVINPIICWERHANKHDILNRNLFWNLGQYHWNVMEYVPPLTLPLVHISHSWPISWPVRSIFIYFLIRFIVIVIICYLLLHSAR